MGYAEQGLGDEAMTCFRQMLNNGLCPDGVTFICLLKVCGSQGLIDMGKEIHASASRQGLLEKDAVLCTALLDMYARCGKFKEAQDVFNKLLIPNTLSWNTLISGYARHGLDEKVLELFYIMCRDGVSPDAGTFLLVLKACGNIGSLDIGEGIQEEVCRREDFLLEEKNVSTMLFTALVDMYAKCGLVRKAQEMFNQIETPNLASWTALMAGYAQLGEAQMVLVIFSQLTIQGMLPDSLVFVILLTACSHRGLLEEGQIIFNAMSSIYSLTPTYEHYNCMVDLFGRAGRFVEAVLMIELVPYSDRLPLWSTLLGACRIWANVDLGRWAFKQSIQLDAKCAATYVCLRNILAFADIPKGKTYQVSE
jgi:pentatricopeptide repeat protein